MAIREGRWDCPSCGSKAVYGRHVDCPGCGKPRPAGIRFYLTDDAPVITDPAQLAEARAGADWVCAHCGASTRASLAECGGCGAARGTSPSQPVIDYAMGAVPRSGAAGSDAPLPAAGLPADPPITGSSADPLAADPRAVDPLATVPAGDAPGAPLRPGDPGYTSWQCWSCHYHNAGHEASCWHCRSPREKPPPRPPLPWWKIALRVVAVLVGAPILMIGVLIVDEILEGEDRPRPPGALEQMLAYHPATVTAVHWERGVVIEERSVVEGTSPTLPDSAQVLSQQRGVVRYEQEQGYETVYGEESVDEEVTTYETRTRQVSERVRTGTSTYTCGQRDQGNGYFEDVTCSQPVYETVTRTETFEEPVTTVQSGTRTTSRRVPRTRSRPVYGLVYSWRAPRWTPLDTVVARDSVAPAWPSPALGPNQRGARRERYLATVRHSAGREEEIELTYDEWKQLHAGTPVSVRFNLETQRTGIFPADRLDVCVRWRETHGVAPPEFGCQPDAATGTASIVEPTTW